MRFPTVRVLTLLVLTAPLLAQGSKPQKPSKAKKGDAAAAKANPGDPAEAARSKDDAVTKKDPAIAALDKFIDANKVDGRRDGWRTSLVAPPKQEFAADRDYLWHLATNKGELVIRLRPDAAPMHVTSAIYLTRRGFYDGLSFHRVIKGFMAQGGCPLGNGNGSPGYTIDGECSERCKHDKPGILSTANENRPKTDGSQFFITFVPTPHLDGKHTVFGEVIEGMPTVEALDACGGSDGSDKPTEKLTIERAWIAVVLHAGADAGGGSDGKSGPGKGTPGKTGKEP